MLPASHETTALSETQCQDPRVSRVYLGGDFLFHYKMTKMGFPNNMTDKGAILQHYFIELTVLWMP